jgi:hypothetical protein
MRRSFLTLALAGLVGGLLLASDAQACHKKKARCAPAPCAAPCPPPAPVCYVPAPCPPPPCYTPCEAPRKKHCCGGAGLFKRRHKASCTSGC